MTRLKVECGGYSLGLGHTVIRLKELQSIMGNISNGKLKTRNNRMNNNIPCPTLCTKADYYRHYSCYELTWLPNEHNALDPFLLHSSVYQNWHAASGLCIT